MFGMIRTTSQPSLLTNAGASSLPINKYSYQPTVAVTPRRPVPIPRSQPTSRPTPNPRRTTDAIAPPGRHLDHANSATTATIASVASGQHGDSDLNRTNLPLSTCTTRNPSAASRRRTREREAAGSARVGQPMLPDLWCRRVSPPNHYESCPPPPPENSPRRRVQLGSSPRRSRAPSRPPATRTRSAGRAASRRWAVRGCGGARDQQTFSAVPTIASVHNQLFPVTCPGPRGSLMSSARHQSMLVRATRHIPACLVEADA